MIQILLLLMVLLVFSTCAVNEPLLQEYENEETNYNYKKNENELESPISIKEAIDPQPTPTSESNDFASIILENSHTAEGIDFDDFIHEEILLKEKDVDADYGGYKISVIRSSNTYDNHISLSEISDAFYEFNDTNAGNFIEYPIISGLNNLDIQDKVNSILKSELYEQESEFQSPHGINVTSVKIGFANHYILSLTFERFYPLNVARSHIGGLNIDLRTGELIRLSDIITVDERLLSNNDGVDKTYDFYRQEVHSFQKFIDAFRIYEKEEDRAFPNLNSKDTVILRLSGPASYTSWYITENKEITFIDPSGSWRTITIPYESLTDIIHPEYYAIFSDDI